MACTVAPFDMVSESVKNWDREWRRKREVGREWGKINDVEMEVKGTRKRQLEWRGREKQRERQYNVQMLTHVHTLKCMEKRRTYDMYNLWYDTLTDLEIRRVRWIQKDYISALPTHLFLFTLSLLICFTLWLIFLLHYLYFYLVSPTISLTLSLSHTLSHSHSVSLPISFSY